MKTFLQITTLVMYASLQGCASYEPFTEARTANRQAVSVMNSETVANAMDSVRGGREYDCATTVATVTKETVATTDVDTGRRNVSRFNRGNQVNRRIFYDSSESVVALDCAPRSIE
jgi:hypothetical protein